MIEGMMRRGDIGRSVWDATKCRCEEERLNNRMLYTAAMLPCDCRAIARNDVFFINVQI